MYMKNIAIASVLMVVLFCTSCRNSTNMTPNAKTESLDSMQNGQSGVNNYCHKEYDWSAAKENPSMMYVQMGDETDAEYKVVFRSYTGSFVYFYVDKATGKTRMVDFVPALNIEEESGTIDLLEYLKEK